MQIYFQHFIFRWPLSYNLNAISCMAFRCHLLVETVDVEVRITSMQGTHMFRRDRTCQLIKCNLWSTKCHPHPTIIKKMKTYLELEGKLGPKPQSQSNQFRPHLPDTNPQVRKESKVTEKRKRLIPTKKYKVKVVTRPDPSNATMQPPQANAKSLVNPESQTPPTSENSPPTFRRCPCSCEYSLSQSWENVWQSFPIEERLANSPCHQHCHCYCNKS